MNVNAQIDRIQSALPNIACQKLCQPSCGPVLMSKPELDRIRARLKRPPAPTGDLTCPLLSVMGDCTVYDIRPTICRIYGLTPALRCPHGCIPERWISDREAQRILREIHNLTPHNGFYTPYGDDV